MYSKNLDSNYIISFSDLESLAVRNTNSENIERNYYKFERLIQCLADYFGVTPPTIRIRSADRELLPIMAICSKFIREDMIKNIYNRKLLPSELFSVLVMCAEIVKIKDKTGLPLLLIYGIEEIHHAMLIFKVFKK